MDPITIMGGAQTIGPSHLICYRGDKSCPCLVGIELRQTYQIQVTLDKKLSGDVSSFAKWASSGVIFSPSCYAVYNWTASRQAARAAPCAPVGGLAGMVAGGSVAALRCAVRSGGSGRAPSRFPGKVIKKSQPTRGHSQTPLRRFLVYRLRWIPKL